MAKANQELEQQQANGENVDMEQNPSEEHIKMVQCAFHCFALFLRSDTSFSDPVARRA